MTNTLETAVRFLMVGALGAALNFGAYVGLLHLGLHYAIAVIVAWAAATLVGYWLNRAFTFKSAVPVSRSLPRVIGIYAAQQLLALAIIALLVEQLGVGRIAAYLAATIPATIFSYSAMKWWALPAASAD